MQTKSFSSATAGDDSEYNYSISRYELDAHLLNAADKAGVHIEFDHQLSETSEVADSSSCVLHFFQGDKHRRIQCNCPIIACDGAGSRTRLAMRHAGLTSFQSQLLPRGYKEVLFPKPEKHFGVEECDGTSAVLFL